VRLRETVRVTEKKRENDRERQGQREKVRVCGRQTDRVCRDRQTECACARERDKVKG